MSNAGGPMSGTGRVRKAYGFVISIGVQLFGSTCMKLGSFLWRFRRGWQGSTRWVRFPYRARSYTERTMLDPLLETIEQTITRYRRGRPANVEEFNLMLHYTHAFEFNAPEETDEFGFEQLGNVRGSSSTMTQVALTASFW
jgi:hypothetical protein